MTGTTGPNVSSRMSEHRVVDARQHRRLEEGAAGIAARAADEDLRALRTRVVDVALDDLDLARAGERAEVDVGVAGRSAPTRSARTCSTSFAVKASATGAST